MQESIKKLERLEELLYNDWISAYNKAQEERALTRLELIRAALEELREL